LKKRECSNCRYMRKTKEFWCKCTGLPIDNIEDTCDKWDEEKLIKICDNCGKEFSEAGLIFAKKKDGLDLHPVTGEKVYEVTPKLKYAPVLCPDCTKMVCNKIGEIRLKGVRQNNDSDGN